MSQSEEVEQGTCVGHSSSITHIDFSKEGALLQSTCSAKELLYWQVCWAEGKGSRGCNGLLNKLFVT